MDVVVIVALIGLTGTIVAPIIASKWAKKTTENKFLVTIQTSYTKLISDLELTNKKLREQRNKDEAQIEADKIKIDSHIVQYSELKIKLNKIEIALGISETQRCLRADCKNKISP